MMPVSTPYELNGRTAQKQRTRNALIAAARQLLADGETLTVEATADAADISRTTAYRYFPNQRALLAASYPQVELTSLLPDDPPDDPTLRLDLAIERVLELLIDAEPQLRAMLLLSLDGREHSADELPLRQGRVIPWLTEALEPARAIVGDDVLRRLVLAIRAAVGIEALVWLVDVAGLSRAQAVEQMRWTARLLLRAALADADS